MKTYGSGFISKVVLALLLGVIFSPIFNTDTRVQSLSFCFFVGFLANLAIDVWRTQQATLKTNAAVNAEEK